MRKHIYRAVTFLAIIATMTACKKQDENVTVYPTGNTTTAVQNTSEPATETSTEAPTEPEVKEPVVLKRGSVVENVYVNNDIGFKLPLDGIYKSYSDGDIAYIYGYGNSIDLSNGYTKEAIEAANKGFVVDYSGILSDYKSSITVANDNLTISNGGQVTEEVYLTNIGDKLSTSVYPMYTVDEKLQKVTIAGKEYTMLKAWSTSTGEKVTEEYYVKRYDDYMHYIKAVYTFADRESSEERVKSIIGGITE